MKLSPRGFTLVELMIVIAIIGILAAALFPSLTAYLKRSRDAGRSANLNTIATAVGGFYSDKETYPSSSSGCLDGMANFTDGAGLPNYFPKGTPSDTKGAVQSPCGRGKDGLTTNTSAGSYGFGGNGTGYILSSKFENLNGGNLNETYNPTYTGTSVDPSVLGTKISKGTGAIYVMVN